MQRREDDWYRVGEEHTYRPPQPKKDNDEEGPPSDQKSGFHFIGPDLKNHNMRIIVGLLTMIVGILLSTGATLWYGLIIAGFAWFTFGVVGKVWRI